MLVDRGNAKQSKVFEVRHLCADDRWLTELSIEAVEKIDANRKAIQSL